MKERGYYGTRSKRNSLNDHLCGNAKEPRSFQRRNIMNKAELVAEVAKLADLNKKQADAAVAAVIDAVTYALKKGEKVQLVGFGSFEAKERAARMGRNPKTKEEIKIPATKVATFKAGKALKDAVAD